MRSSLFSLFTVVNLSTATFLGYHSLFWENETHFGFVDEGSSGCKSTQEHLVYPGHWARGQISQTSNIQNMGVGARDGFRRKDHEQLNAKDSTH